MVVYPKVGELLLKLKSLKQIGTARNYRPVPDIHGCVIQA